MNDKTIADHPDSSEQEERQISRLLTGLSASAVIFLAGIGAKAWHADHTTHAWVLWLFILPIVLNIGWYALKRDRYVQKAGLLITVSLLFAYLLASGGESNTGPLWFYVFPPLLFYLTSLKGGTAILLFCYLVALIVFQFPGLPFVTAEYSIDFKIRFFATLTFESLFCFVLEASRLRARNKLLELAKAHEYAARTDELTGLANRRDMQSRLNMEFSRFKRAGHHFSVVLIDLDLFKRVNDDYGHDAGDAVLQQFSEPDRNHHPAIGCGRALGRRRIPAVAARYHTAAGADTGRAPAVGSVLDRIPSPGGAIARHHQCRRLFYFQSQFSK